MIYFSAPGILRFNDPFRLAAILFDITVEDIQSSKRDRDILNARAILYNYFKQNNNYSLSKIGRMVGKRNYATVIHGLKQYNNLIETDKDFRDKVRDFKANLNSF